MLVKAWNNGAWNQSGAGYGLRISKNDRDIFFNRAWSNVILDLPNGINASINLSTSFWNKCPEIRKAEIGRWLISSGYGNWPHGNPSIFQMVQLRGNHFRVI